LVAGKSLLWKDREIWSPSNLQRFKACFIDQPDTSKDKNFEQKFKIQLATEDEDVTRLACELLFVYFLFTSCASLRGTPDMRSLLSPIVSGAFDPLQPPTVPTFCIAKSLFRYLVGDRERVSRKLTPHALRHQRRDGDQGG
jgi:hypothetical protein